MIHRVCTDRNFAKRRRTLSVLILLSALLLLLIPITPAFCHSEYVIIAVYGTKPIIDGTISAGEWTDATTFTFGSSNQVTAYVKQDGANLYFAFNIIDDTPYPPMYPHTSDKCLIRVDIANNGVGEYDDLIVAAQRYRPNWEGRFDSDNQAWGHNQQTEKSHWPSSDTSTSSFWQAEYRLPFSKIGVTAATKINLGVYFQVADYTNNIYHWPPCSNTNSFNDWADLTSVPLFQIPEMPSTIAAMVIMLVALIGYSIHKK